MDGSGPELGKASIPAADENGEPIDIPVSAETLRDAIALRGKDAAKAMKKIAKPEAEEKPAKEEKPAEEEKETKPVGTYKRSGGRTLLKDGKGKPFTSNKEVADFLAENGFEYTEKVTTKDGRELPVFAHSKQQTDEEFKAIARELRDRFGIDLKPRPATTQSPAQEEIDFDAPSLEKPSEEAPIPAPALSREEQKIADLENELEMVERLIKQDDVKPSVKDKMAKRIENIKKEIEDLRSGEKAEEKPAATPPTTPPSPPTPTPSPEPDPEEEPKLRSDKRIAMDNRNNRVNENQKIITQDRNVFTLDGKFLGKIPEGFSLEDFFRAYYYRAARTDRDAESIFNAIKPSEKDKPYDADVYPTREEEEAIEEAIKKDGKEKSTKKTNKAKKIVIVESDEED